MTINEYNRTVDELADRLFRFVVKNLPERETARDIVQDAFEKLWVKRHTVDPEKVKTYLFTTAYHQVIDHYRKAGRMEYRDKLPYTDTLHEGSYSDLKECIDEGLKKLPETQRLVITLRDLEGYSYEEIEAITGLNASQVKVYIYRARVALKNFVGKIENLI